MNRVPLVFALLMCTIAPADAQRRQDDSQNGERPLRIGSWSGTVELDAFTRKERIIVSSERNGVGIVLRCMGEKLSVGWINLALFKGPFETGDKGELSLRVGEDVIGPFRLTALSPHFMAGDISHAELANIAEAKSEIGFRFSHESVVRTGGVRAQRTADVSARLKKSCPEAPTRSSHKPAPAPSSSKGGFNSLPSIKPHIEARDPSLVSEETAHRAYHALKAMCPEAGSWGFVQRVDIIAEPDTSDEARQRGARSSVRIYAVTSMDEHAFELTGGASPVVFAEPSAWRLLCGEKAPLADSKGNVTAPALSFLP